MFSLMVLEHRQGSVKGKGSEILPSVKVHVPDQDADVVLLDEPTGHLDLTLGAWSALGISTQRRDVVVFEGTLPGWWITSIICRTSRKFHPTFFEGRVWYFGDAGESRENGDSHCRVTRCMKLSTGPEVIRMA